MTLDRTLKGMFVGLLATGALTLGVPAASAAQPQCGATIKHDVKLTHDLDCHATSTNGLNIGADGVDIDLNGHVIIGPASSNSGIYNGSGFDGVTVTHGRIRGFNYGIYNYYGSKLTVSRLTINLQGTNDDYGVYLEYSLSPHLDQVTVNNAAYGFYLYDNDRMNLTHSKVTGSDPSTTYGLYDNLSTGSVDGLTADGAEYGAYVAGETSGYTIKNSTFNDAGTTGINVGNSTPLFKYRYTLTKNTANDAGTYGFYASYDVDGSGNKASGAGTKNYNNVPH